VERRGDMWKALKVFTTEYTEGTEKI